MDNDVYNDTEDTDSLGKEDSDAVEEYEHGENVVSRESNVYRVKDPRTIGSVELDCARKRVEEEESEESSSEASYSCSKTSCSSSSLGSPEERKRKEEMNEKMEEEKRRMEENEKAWILMKMIGELPWGLFDALSSNLGSASDKSHYNRTRVYKFMSSLSWVQHHKYFDERTKGKLKKFASTFATLNVAIWGRPGESPTFDERVNELASQYLRYWNMNPKFKNNACALWKAVLGISLNLSVANAFPPDFLPVHIYDLAMRLDPPPVNSSGLVSRSCLPSSPRSTK